MVVNSGFLPVPCTVSGVVDVGVLNRSSCESRMIGSAVLAPVGVCLGAGVLVLVGEWVRVCVGVLVWVWVSF